NEPTIVIEDVITTGGSTRDVIQVLDTAGAQIVAAGSIIDRSNGRVDLGLPRVTLETLNPVTYESDECPLCKQGIPIVKPGSRRDAKPMSIVSFGKRFVRLLSAITFITILIH